MTQDRLKAFLDQLKAFYEERQWKQFHSPKNLAMGVASEAGELLQIFFALQRRGMELHVHQGGLVRVLVDPQSAAHHGRRAVRVPPLHR